MPELADTTLSWLLTPMDTSQAHAIATHQAWHGRLMFLAWGVLLPLGVLIARYFKITPRQNWPEELDHKFWWHSHLLFQHAGVLLMLVGFAIIITNKPFAWPDEFHDYCGWFLILGGLFQFVSGYLRGTKGGPTDPSADGGLHGDHFDMTPRRIWFEGIHKAFGYILLLSGLVGVVSGLWFVNAPKWMWLTIAIVWTAFAGIAIICERKGMQTSSYEAIWGRKP
ncbi:MAG: cytochrome b561 domain-containing protein [Hyphomicrobiales bacterium]